MCHITIIYEYSNRFLTYLTIDRTVIYTNLMCHNSEKKSFCLYLSFSYFHQLFISPLCIFSNNVNFLPYCQILVDCSCKFSYFVLS